MDIIVDGWIIIIIIIIVIIIINVIIMDIIIIFVIIIIIIITGYYGWMNGWMDGWTDGGIDRWMDGRKKGRRIMDKQLVSIWYPHASFTGSYWKHVTRAFQVAPFNKLFLEVIRNRSLWGDIRGELLRRSGLFRSRCVAPNQSTGWYHCYYYNYYYYYY